MSTTALPDLSFPGPWEVLAQRRSTAFLEVDLGHTNGGVSSVRVERCVSGRLENAYPPSVHDVEVQVRGVPGRPLTEVLRSVVASVRAGEPSCRRVVYAARRDDADAVAAAEAAGFRYVVDVDLPTAELSLLVSEAPWAAVGDETADTVPGS